MSIMATNNMSTVFSSFTMLAECLSQEGCCVNLPTAIPTVPSVSEWNKLFDLAFNNTDGITTNASDASH